MPRKSAKPKFVIQQHDATRGDYALTRIGGSG